MNKYTVVVEQPISGVRYGSIEIEANSAYDALEKTQNLSQNELAKLAADTWEESSDPDETYPDGSITAADGYTPELITELDQEDIDNQYFD